MLKHFAFLRATVHVSITISIKSADLPHSHLMTWQQNDIWTCGNGVVPEGHKHGEAGGTGSPLLTLWWSSDWGGKSSWAAKQALCFVTCALGPSFLGQNKGPCLSACRMPAPSRQRCPLQEAFIPWLLVCFLPFAKCMRIHRRFLPCFDFWRNFLVYVLMALCFYCFLSHQYQKDLYWNCPFKWK